MKRAFTLAEVLLVLGIIGTVAALTLPVLINDTNNKVTVVKLKKAYSTLSQATAMVQNSVNNLAKGNDLASVTKFYELYKPYLRLAKDCGCGVSQAGCWSDNTKALNGNDYTYSHKGWIGDYSCSVTLADGTNITFDAWQSENLGIEADDTWAFFMFVDVNGNKKPNTLGKDVFNFAVSRNGLVPAGMQSDSIHCSVTDKNNAYAGMDCTAKVLNEGKTP